MGLGSLPFYPIVDNHLVKPALSGDCEGVDCGVNKDLTAGKGVGANSRLSENRSSRLGEHNLKLKFLLGWIRRLLNGSS